MAIQPRDNTDMASQNLDNFKQLVLQDTALQAKLRSASDQQDFVQQIVKIAQENGYSLTPEEVQEGLIPPSGEELNLEQLEAVAGGMMAQKCYITCGTCTVSYLP